MSDIGDRREFGRRRTQQLAWLEIAGRQRIACTVVNLSANGALLELPYPGPLPAELTLTIEALGFTTRCETRHMSGQRVGVQFLDVGQTGTLDERAIGLSGPRAAPTAEPEQPKGEIALLQALLRDLPEFAEAGYTARIDAAGKRLEILRAGALRGWWQTSQEAFAWHEFGNHRIVSVPDAKSAARRMMSMALATLVASGWEPPEERIS